jgi:hypothetical protein
MRLEFQGAVTEKGNRPRMIFRGNPLAAILVILLLILVLVEVAVGIDFMRDRHAAYEGTVVEVCNRWTDYLTMEFIPVEHLIIETSDGKRQDRLVSMENRVLYRIQPGDQVVKKRGFSNFPRVPGKKTVWEMKAEQAGLPGQ